MTNLINSSLPAQSIPNNQVPFSYVAKSHFGELFKQIKYHETVDSTADIKSVFAKLDRQDKCLIYEMVYHCAGSPNTSDPQWGEYHVFEDMNIFISAAKKAVELKYQRLNDNQKQIVNENIYDLGGWRVRANYIDDPWVQLHATNHLPRLADAMDFCVPLDINSQIPLKLDEALNRFKAHPLYPLLFRKNIFTTENAMRDYYKNAVLEGTCDAQVIELCKLADANPTWSREQLLATVKVENVFYNQIIMFSKTIIGRFHACANTTAEKRQLWSMVECLQTSQPIHLRLNSEEIAPDGDYVKVFPKFWMGLKSKENKNSFHGKVLIKNIDMGGGKRVDHAIFFQFLKKEPIFRFYDINTGFFSYVDGNTFLAKLKENIRTNYCRTNDPLTKVCFSVDADENQFPCKSALGKLYQAVTKNKDRKEIEDDFSLLTRDDKCKIYGKIFQYAGEPSTDDFQWGEHHVFDYPDLLRTAITAEIIQRYAQSDPAKKRNIQVKVASSDANYDFHNGFSPSGWGELHAIENLPRLADAMM